MERHFGHCHMVLGSSLRKSKMGPLTDYTTDGIEARSSRMHAASGPCQSEIGKPEPISLNDLAYGHRDVRAELWAPVAERVKLAPFAAGIDAWGAVLQSGQSGFAPCCGWQEWRTSDHSGLGWTDECRPIIG